MTKDSTAVDFGINLLEEEIDDVIFRTNEFLGLFHLLHVGRHTMALAIGVSPGSNGCRSNKAQYDFHLFCHRLIFSSLTTFYFLHSSLNTLLYLPHDTKPVAAPNLGNVCFAVLAAGTGEC
jgi:hypothetical protein